MLLRLLCTVLIGLITTYGCSFIPGSATAKMDNRAPNRKEIFGDNMRDIISKISINGIDRAVNEAFEYYGIFDSDTHGVLRNYCIDLTEKAEEGQLRPLIGRDKETELLIEILTQKGKANPCIIGEPGVGKTALVEGLAMRIASGNVPDSLKNKKIMMLDITKFVAGTSYKGNYLSRLRALLNVLQSDPDIILFFDEVHTITTMGADLWKQTLNNPDIRIIGATTLNEYGQIYKDDALARRFQTIKISEPTPEETFKIIKGISDGIEKHSLVKITDEAISAAVESTEKYMTNRYFPDKAIDVVSATASMVGRQNPSKVIYNEKGEVQNIKYTEVTEDDVYKIVSRLTGIPIGKIREEEKQNLLTLKNRIGAKIVGQEEAINKVVDAIEQSRLGVKSDNKPIGSFLFAGSYGVGKTELCKVIAQEAYSQKSSFININMSKYSKPETISELIGSPTSKGILSDTVPRMPYSIILFDEIDKADSSIVNLILKIVDDGVLISSDGKKIDFSNTVIIMTTNCCNDVINSAVANSDEFSQRIVENLKENVSKTIFSKVDDVIIFNNLGKDELSKIFDIKWNETRDAFKNLNINVEITPEFKEKVIAISLGDESGARKLIRTINKQINVPISGYMLKDKIKAGQTVKCDFTGDNFKIDIEG